MSFQDVPFSSVLFDGPGRAAGTESSEAPGFFRDLHLDQVVSWILARREEYDLATFFYSPLREANAVRYRQEVFQDLEDSELVDCVRAFAERMRRARSFLKGMSQIETLYFKQGWFLDAAENYWAAVANLLDGLRRLPLRSRRFERVEGLPRRLRPLGGFRRPRQGGPSAAERPSGHRVLDAHSGHTSNCRPLRGRARLQQGDRANLRQVQAGGGQRLLDRVPGL